jgi:hypothetical protein
VRVIGVAVLAWSALGRVVFFHALFKGVLVWVATPNLLLMNTNTNFTKRERVCFLSTHILYYPSSKVVLQWVVALKTKTWIRTAPGNSNHGLSVVDRRLSL